MPAARTRKSRDTSLLVAFFGLVIAIAITVLVSGGHLLPGDRSLDRDFGRGAKTLAVRRATRLVDLVSPAHDTVALLIISVVLALQRRRWRPLLQGIGVAVVLGVVVTVWKAGLHRTGPQGPSQTGSLPSGHLTTLLVCGGAVILLCRAQRRWWAWALLVVAGLGLSADLVYLRDHWLSDLIAAVALASALLAVAWRLGVGADG